MDSSNTQKGLSAQLSAFGTDLKHLSSLNIRFMRSMGTVSNEREDAVRPLKDPNGIGWGGKVSMPKDKSGRTKKYEGL